MVSLRLEPGEPTHQRLARQGPGGLCHLSLSGTARRLEPLSPRALPQIVYQDVAVLNEVEYTYKVLAVRLLGEDLLTSGDSPPRMAMPEKRTPPPPVLDVLAVATSQGVEVRWEPSPAPDVAGYRVYRRSPGEGQAPG